MTFEIIDPNLISELIINILVKRSYYYEFLCGIIDNLKGNAMGVTAPLMYFKALELFIRDINPEEIKLDELNKSFNITNYIKQSLRISDDLEIVETLNEVKEELEDKITHSIEELPGPIKIALE